MAQIWLIFLLLFPPIYSIELSITLSSINAQQIYLQNFTYLFITIGNHNLKIEESINLVRPLKNIYLYLTILGIQYMYNTTWSRTIFEVQFISKRFYIIVSFFWGLSMSKNRRLSMSRKLTPVNVKKELEKFQIDILMKYFYKVYYVCDSYNSTTGNKYVILSFFIMK